MALYLDFVRHMNSGRVLASNYNPAIHATLHVPSYHFDDSVFAGIPLSTATNGLYNSEYMQPVCTAYVFQVQGREIVVLVNYFCGNAGIGSPAIFFYTFEKIAGRWLNVCDHAVQGGHITQHDHDATNQLALSLVLRAIWLLQNKSVTHVISGGPLLLKKNAKATKKGKPAMPLPKIVRLTQVRHLPVTTVFPTGSGSPKSPHERATHSRKLKNGDTITVRASKIKGGIAALSSAVQMQHVVRP